MASCQKKFGFALLPQKSQMKVRYIKSLLLRLRCIKLIHVHLKRSDDEGSHENGDQICKKPRIEEDPAEKRKMWNFVESIIDSFDNQGPADFSVKFDVEKFRDHFAKQAPIDGKVGPYLCPRTGQHFFAPRQNSWLVFAEDRSPSFNRTLFNCLVEFFTMKWTYHHLKEVLDDAKINAPIASDWSELELEFKELNFIGDIVYTLLTHKDLEVE